MFSTMKISFRSSSALLFSRYTPTRNNTVNNGTDFAFLGARNNVDMLSGCLLTLFTKYLYKNSLKSL